ncbi:hypothetical protein [Paenibacillus oceani]|uniref:Uncharacterized protein n=1 Tax=Paenibacillus oceani TaxID=2772510 RepID=A0A927CFD4_9BACL|nr:hypothetical protein [Paenibacillus oceani]MBD2866454.1 hypothetical protein [Paenibacillus oceani]
MQTKLAVQFRPSRNTSCAFERLKTCKKCGAYSVLFDDRCKECGATGKFIPVARYIASLNRVLPMAEAFGAVALVALAVVLANDWMQIAAAGIGGAAFLALLFLLRQRYKPYADLYRFHEVLVDHTPAILKGIRADLQEADGDMSANHPKEAYEKLREIGYLLNNESIKQRKIACLRRFYIRKDMELELDPLVPKKFDPEFVLYMRDAVKVNRQLVRHSALDYVVAFRPQIEAMEGGREFLVSMAGSALRMKKYVQMYPRFIIDYLDELPRERFHRLCKLLADTPVQQRNELYAKCKETAQTRYAVDPDFQGMF